MAHIAAFTEPEAFEVHDLLFVYGSLKSDSPHPMARWLERHARLLGPARFQGRLIRVSWYPGALDSDHAGDSIQGELWQLLRPKTVLRRLDRYEGYDPAHPGRSEFVRVLRPVSFEGNERRAWIYLYAGRKAARAPRANSGFMHRRAKGFF